MAHDPIKARERRRRYKLRKKVEKYGPDAADTDMRGRHHNHARGSENARWNAKRITSSHGYVKVCVGRDHPLADPNGYAYEHLLVWVTAGNPVPGRGEIIHHRSEDKTDNRLSNLMLLSRSAHAAHHNAERERKDDGRFISRGGHTAKGGDISEFPADLQVREYPR